MDPAFLLKGAAIGFGVAAPVGPIGVLCIRRSIRDGAWAGFIAGLGAATADAAFGAVAGFGLTSISGFLVQWQFWLGLCGGVFLCFLGVRAFLDKAAESAAPVRSDRLPSVYASTLLLTLSNPATILSFAAIFAGLGIGLSADYRDAGALVLGVFAGSAFWWSILSSGVGCLRSRVTPAWTRTINRVSGCVLLSFGIYAIFRSLAQ
jgi:threonine/homoserine/homoserine lactone efflux protein